MLKASIMHRFAFLAGDPAGVWDEGGEAVRRIDQGEFVDQLNEMTRRTASRRSVMRGAAALAGAGLLGTTISRVALGQGASVGILPQAVYAASEYAFDGPTQLTAGLNRLIMRNDGEMEHHAMFLRLNDGKTVADFAAAAQQGLGEMLAVVTGVGGPGSIGPGRATTVILDLAAGDYLVVCLIPDADGVPHMAKGMLLPVQVAEGSATPEAGATAPAAPTADVTIEMGDFAFAGITESVSPGSKVWEVVNVGEQLHEVVIYQLASGVDQAQVEAVLDITGGTEGGAAAASPMAGMEYEEAPAAEASPASAGVPFNPVAGFAPTSPGTSGWIQFDLAKGSYFAVCFVPDMASGAPHFMLGMIQFFTVE